MRVGQPRSSLEAALDQPTQFTGLEVRLADLHQIDSRGGGLADLPHKEILDALPVGNPREQRCARRASRGTRCLAASRRRSHASLGSAAHIRPEHMLAVSCAGRAQAAASSASPAPILSAPTPETAPRMNSLRLHRYTAGIGFQQRVLVPERGPRNDDEQEAHLEEVGGEEQTPEQISLRCPSRHV